MNLRELRVGLRVSFIPHPQWAGRITRILKRGRAVVRWTKPPGETIWFHRPRKVTRAEHLSSTAIDKLAAVIARTP